MIFFYFLKFCYCSNINYDDYKKIADGSTGEVLKFYDKTIGKHYAIKIRYRHDNPDQYNHYFEQEKKCLSMLNHKNVVKYYKNIFFLEKINIILEYLPYSLAEIEFKKYSSKTFDFTLQLLEGIQYIHSKNIIHRDIKPENILLSKNFELKIADFGHALIKNKEAVNNNYVVARAYRSPELIDKCEVYDSYIDMWSIGCLIYYIYTKKDLFIFENKDKLSEKIKEFCSNDIETKLRVNLANTEDVIIKIVIGCLNIDFNERFSATYCIYLLNEYLQMEKLNNPLNIEQN